jgi:hypothetical protein
MAWHGIDCLPCHGIACLAMAWHCLLAMAWHCLLAMALLACLAMALLACLAMALLACLAMALLACHVMSCHCLSCHVIACLAMSLLVLPCHCLPCHVIACLAMSLLALLLKWFVSDFHFSNGCQLFCLFFTVHITVDPVQPFNTSVQQCYHHWPVIHSLAATFPGVHFLRCRHSAISKTKPASLHGKPIRSSIKIHLI